MLGMSADEVLRASRVLVERLIELPEFQAAKNLLVCVSFRNEPNTWPLLLNPGVGKRLFVPRAVPSERRLAVHPYPTPLRRSAFGILEPLADAPELAPQRIDQELDLAVIVGAAYSRLTRHRIGWGKAYFDAFLAAHPRIVSVALAYAWQLHEDVPHEAHDVPMRIILSESERLTGT